MTTGLAVPERTALIERPGAIPPPTSSMTWRSGVPSSISATPGRTTSPTTVATTVPGDRSVPSDRYHSGPRASTRGTVARVSTLLTTVGLDAANSVATPPGDEVHPAAGTVANSPWMYGGMLRGRGASPSITCSRPVSSP